MFKYFKRRFYTWQEAFLEDNPEDYRNGFYFRTLSTKIGKLNLEIPQVYHDLELDSATTLDLLYYLQDGKELTKNTKSS
ncbi:MAG: hypothetical protein ACP5UF_07425 [Hydrogenobaculum sp.]